MPENNISNTTLLPYSMEAEQAVLGSVLTDPNCMEIIIDKIKPEYFYLPQHKIIFSSMVTMYAGSKAKIDPVVIADVLVKEGQYDLSGGREYLLTLKDNVPSTANVETYAKIVEEQFFLRSLITVSKDVIDKAQSGAVEANELLSFAEQQIYDISKGKEVSGPKKISDVIINDVYDNLYKITGEDKDQYKGVASGFSTLDKYITGLNKSDFILIGARPAMGKTSFALNLAHRLLASFAGIPSQKLLTGELDKDEWARLGNAAGAFNDVELYLDDTASITVPEIKSRVMRMKDVDIIIIDYLSLIQSATKRDNRAQEVSEITRHLKMLAKDLNIPVVCCAQLNRGTEGRGKSHKPQLSDLRESGSIEQDADIVLFLYREEYYKNELDDEKQEEVDISRTELIVAKNRHGPTGSIEMTFDKEFTRFRAIDKQYDE